MVYGPSKPWRVMQCSYNSWPSWARSCVWGAAGKRPWLRRSSTSAPSLGLSRLLALDAFEQRPEVAGAEALVTLALDQLVEEGARLIVVIQARRLFEEDLQQ